MKQFSLTLRLQAQDHGFAGFSIVGEAACQVHFRAQKNLIWKRVPSYNQMFENSVHEGPPMLSPQDQGPYPVRGTITETNNPSATHESVFGSLLNRLSSFLPGNTSTSPAATTTDHSQMTTQYFLTKFPQPQPPHREGLSGKYLKMKR